MQNIDIKSGASATINITPKINGVEATSEQLTGVIVYVFFVHQFTNKIYDEPYELTTDSGFTIELTSEKTIEMFGNAEDNQKYEIQFAIKTADGDVIAEETDSNIRVNIIRWEAGLWLNQGQ